MDSRYAGAGAAFRAAVIYVAFFAAMRLFGKREIGQFTLFDLVLVLLGANALQPAMTGTVSSLIGGLILIATLFAIDRAISFLVFDFPLSGVSWSSGLPPSGGTAAGACARWSVRGWTSWTWKRRFASTDSTASSR